VAENVREIKTRDLRGWIIVDVRVGLQYVHLALREIGTRLLPTEEQAGRTCLIDQRLRLVVKLALEPPAQTAVGVQHEDPDIIRSVRRYEGVGRSDPLISSDEGGEDALQSLHVRSHRGQAALHPRYLSHGYRVHRLGDLADVLDVPDARLDLANEKGAYGRLVVVYMHFVSDLAQRLRVEEILPIRVEARPGEMILEPDPARMFDIVLPLYLQGKVFQMLLDTKTSEDAIRRQAMSSATDNADELLKNLTRSYNKARQQSITREISDIMGGAEALRD